MIQKGDVNMIQHGPAVSQEPGLAPGTYRLDPERTTIRADVRAMFGLMTVHGTFRIRDGEAVIAEDPALSGMRASIDAASFASGNATRDADVASPALLDAGAYPDITFTGRVARRDGSEWVVPGSVTAHGVAAPAEVRVRSARMEDGAGRFLAVAVLDRTSFGVTRKKGCDASSHAVSECVEGGWLMPGT